MKVYMDHTAGCPVDDRVIETMLPYMKEMIGNPSSVHSMGMEARNAIEEARERLKSFINASEGDVIFTGGATESNNLAIIGYAFRNRDKGKHIITSAIEHMSVMNPCKYLQRNGFEVSYLSVDKDGRVNPDDVENEIRDDTILISIQHANGEIGTIQPVEEVGKIARERGIAFHVDAVASLGKIDVNVEKINADMLTLSSNDIYGPRGVGGLYVGKGVRIQPVILGGGQEKGLRSGTENVAGIAGFGKAAEIMEKEFKKEAEREKKLRDNLISGVLETIEDSYLNGHPIERLPNNANLRFSYIEGEALILNLDMEGIYASTGSACTSKTLQPSHVLMAIGLKHEEAHGSLLFTLGKWNTGEHVKYVLDVLPNVVRKLREISPLYKGR